MIDYLDEDVAYLLGLITGRGEIVVNDRHFFISIHFPFQKTELEGMDQFSGFVASVASSILPRLKNLLGASVELSVYEDKNVAIIAEFNKENMIVRNLGLILGTTNYRDFIVPDVVMNNKNKEIQLEFLRGFSDTSANIRRSNRDINGEHRVYLDVLNSNWHLPVSMCELIQDKLSIPVDSIIWGHPSFNRSLREHQIRIYAHNFLEVGFYIEHKQKVLQILAEENRKKEKNFCDGHKRIREKNKKENFPDSMPDNLKKHFDAFWQICAQMGCNNAKKYMDKK
ncbi:hypothetical protein J7M00_01585 [bacterium]|nr:hypothetical protein [bacterium]